MSANVAISMGQDQQKAGAARFGTATTTTAWVWGRVAMQQQQQQQQYQEEDDSWEARAFAEDASSLSGGVWPPRSYSCSFCRREFRSAQALGGHMNVHRRDRARLRQSPPSDPHPHPHPNPPFPSPAAPLSPSHPLDYNPPGLCLLYPIPPPSSLIKPLIGTPTGPHNTPPHSFPSYSAPPGFDSSLHILGDPWHPSAAAPGSSFAAQDSNPDVLLDRNASHRRRDNSVEKLSRGAFEPYQYAQHANSDDADMPDGVDLELRLGQKP